MKVTSVGVGRRAAVQFAEELGCDQATLWRVRLSLSEAISNVVLHAHPDDPSGRSFELQAASDATTVRFAVVDDGIGMVPREDSPGMGAGLAIIATAADDMSVKPGAAGGTAVHMTFRRKPG